MISLTVRTTVVESLDAAGMAKNNPKNKEMSLFYTAQVMISFQTKVGPWRQISKKQRFSKLPESLRWKLTPLAVPCGTIWQYGQWKRTMEWFILLTTPVMNVCVYMLTFFRITKSFSRLFLLLISSSYLWRRQDTKITCTYQISPAGEK